MPFATLLAALAGGHDERAEVDRSSTNGLSVRLPKEIVTITMGIPDQARRSPGPGPAVSLGATPGAGCVFLRFWTQIASPDPHWLERAQRKPEQRLDTLMYDLSAGDCSASRVGRATKDGRHGQPTNNLAYPNVYHLHRRA